VAAVVFVLNDVEQWVFYNHCFKFILECFCQECPVNAKGIRTDVSQVSDLW
jgi:hypothetical protein